MQKYFRIDAGTCISRWILKFMYTFEVESNGSYPFFMVQSMREL